MASEISPTLPKGGPEGNPSLHSPAGTVRCPLLRSFSKVPGLRPASRALDPEGWRRQLGHVRNTAIGLARQGKLVITRHGKPADPESFKGVYRLRLPEA